MRSLAGASPGYSANFAVSAWKHRFSSQCLSVVHEQAFGARTPNYKIIQELDKKVRGFYIPPSLQVPGFSGKPTTASLVPPGEAEVPSMQLTMQRYTTWAIKEISTRASSNDFSSLIRCCASDILYASRVLCQGP